jgi:nicotinamide-nucleotide amidase
MNAEIVLTGTELLLGEIVDTNSVMVSQMLRGIGLDVHYKTTVGDNERRIIEVLRIALGRVDFVIVSGGLGPTVDDVTRQAAAAATGRKLVYSQELEEQIAARFRKFGRQMAENNKRQAWIPEGAIPVENPVGTAPCFIVEAEEGTIICLPGVPRELKYQMENAIIPYLKEKMGETQLIKARILRTCAIGESDIDRTIDDLMRLSNPTIGLAAHLGQVDVRITAKAATEAEADALIAPVEAEVRKRLGDVIFGVDRETLPEVVGQLLKQHQLRLVLIDTMTKGAISYSLREAGYSEQVSGETVFDSMVAAQARLGLSAQALANDGEATASRLARQLHQPDAIGLCILGPITTAAGDIITWVALAHDEQVEVRQSRIAYANETRQPWVIAQALNLVWRQLRGY